MPSPSKNIQSDPEPLSFGEVIEQTLFLAPACGGLVLIGLTMLWGSAFQWVLICTYVVGIPALFLYVRNRPPPRAGETSRQRLTAIAVSLREGDLQSLGQALMQSRRDPNLDDQQVERTIVLFNATALAFKTFCDQLEPSRRFPVEQRERLIAAGEKALSSLFNDLRTVASVFAKLGDFNTKELLRKAQYPRLKNQGPVKEHSRAENQHQDKLEARNANFSRVIAILDPAERVAFDVQSLAAHLPQIADDDAEAIVQAFERVLTPRQPASH